MPLKTFSSSSTLETFYSTLTYPRSIVSKLKYCFTATQKVWTSGPDSTSHLKLCPYSLFSASTATTTKCPSIHHSTVTLYYHLLSKFANYFSYFVFSWLLLSLFFPFLIINMLTCVHIMCPDY